MSDFDPSDLAVLLKRHIAYLNGKSGGLRANMSLKNFSGMKFGKVVLAGANMAGANFQGCNFVGANLSGCDLFGADLSQADLRGANLTKADLRGAILYRADLTNANLASCDMRPGALIDAKAKLAKKQMTDEERSRAQQVTAEIGAPARD